VTVSPRNIFPPRHPGLPTWYEVRIASGYLAPARRRPHGAMNPQTWDKDVAASSRRLSLLRFDQADADSKFRRNSRPSHEADRICNASTGAAPAPALKNIILCRRPLGPVDIHIAVIETRSASSSGKDKLIPPTSRPSIWPRLRLEHLACPIGLRVKRADRSASHLPRGQQPRRRWGLRLCGATVAPVSDHPLLVGRRGLRPALRRLPRRSGDDRSTVRRHPGRTSSPRSACVIAPRGTGRRLHRDFRPGHLLDAGVHRPRLFRRDPRVIFDVHAGGRDRHADAHQRPTCSPAPMQPLATPSSASLPARPARMLHHGADAFSTRRSAADADFSFPISISA